MASTRVTDVSLLAATGRNKWKRWSTAVVQAGIYGRSARSGTSRPAGGANASAARGRQIRRDQSPKQRKQEGKEVHRQADRVKTVAAK